ncbi:MAG: SDR family oxidoreductase [Clostridia bacterium]|nr:SDR family oxidoreductase [Clostridia bacterium]
MKALITGASSGIGRDMARILANDYDELVLVARNEDHLKDLQIELSENSNAKIQIVSMDLSVPENCIRLHSENPNVDLLINNAGFGDCGDFAETDLSKDLTMINTNVTAYHILTKLYLADMKTANKGHILNVASIAGFMPGPLMATYYATKNYVVRLSESIREELRRAKSDVKISILCPGPVDTNFNKVANVAFSMKGLTSQYVAKYALKHLNRFYIVPGTNVKLARIGAHLLPSAWIARITYKVQQRKIER